MDAPFQYEDFLSSIYPSDRDMVHAVVQKSLEPLGTGDYEYEYRVVHPQGEIRWIYAKGKASFETRDGNLVAKRLIGTVLDRTEHKKSQEALIEAERLATTGRLAASIVHEIKNPLDAVTNILYLLEGEPSEQVRLNYLIQAREELARVEEIASSTLDFYRDPVGFTEFDLGEMARSVLVLFHGQIAVQQIQVEADLPKDVFVAAPQGELRQVCVNLISNALDAMPKGGRLILRVRRFFDHHARRTCVRLTIADTGHGMPPHVLKRIFEAFYSTKGTSGNGIGLWLSLEIIKKCGSAMKVRSAEGRGTVFHVSLVGAAGKADLSVPSREVSAETSTIPRGVFTTLLPGKLVSSKQTR